jgi:hypothetical protein
MKLTEWYSGDQKLVRDGPYQRRNEYDEIGYSYFENYLWSPLYRTLDDARTGDVYESWYQNLPWRGIEK